MRGGANDTVNTIAFDRTDAGAFPRIVADFDFRIGSGADGLGFALLATSEFGTTGAAPLFAERPLVDGSLGVGFDTFLNPETDDPNHNFLRLTYDGAIVATVANPGVSLESGAFLHAQMLVESVAGGAEVTLTLTPAIGAPSVPLDHFFVAGYAPYETRVAFGARTGAVTANHDLDNVVVQFVPEPGTVVMLAMGLAVLGMGRLRGPSAAL